MNNKAQFTINFQPVGKRVESETSQSLLLSAQMGGVSIASICGGLGICDSCRVRLIQGKLTTPTIEEEALFTDEEIEMGYRLACQAYPLSDLTIEIPPESLTAPQRLQIEGGFSVVEIDPPVIPVKLDIPEPTIEDLRSDTLRVKDSLTDIRFSHINYKYPVLETISPHLRRNKWHVTLAIRNNTVVAILPQDSPILGLAVDVGTTKLAAYL